MHPRTEELLAHLDVNRAVLRAAVDSVPAELQRTRPIPDEWSVAEVLEHLTKVEDQITRFLGAKLAEARSAGQLAPATDATPITGLLNHEAIIDRRRTVTAGERVQPRGEMDSETALGTLDRTREKLRELVASVDGLTLDAVSFPHPALGVINGYQWFLFVGSHEARHAAQIRQIATALGSSSSAETSGEDSTGARRARVQHLLRSAERAIGSAHDGFNRTGAIDVATMLADVERATPGGAPLHAQLDTVKKWVDALARPDDHARFGGSTHVRDHVLTQLRLALAAADDYFRQTS